MQRSLAKSESDKYTFMREIRFEPNLATKTHFQVSQTLVNAPLAKIVCQMKNPEKFVMQFLMMQDASNLDSSATHIYIQIYLRQHLLHTQTHTRKHRHQKSEWKSYIHLLDAQLCSSGCITKWTIRNGHCSFTKLPHFFFLFSARARTHSFTSFNLTAPKQYFISFHSNWVHFIKKQ